MNVNINVNRAYHFSMENTILGAKKEVRYCCSFLLKSLIVIYVFPCYLTWCAAWCLRLLKGRLAHSNGSVGLISSGPSLTHGPNGHLPRYFCTILPVRDEFWNYVLLCHPLDIYAFVNEILKTRHKWFVLRAKWISLSKETNLMSLINIYS